MGSMGLTKTAEFLKFQFVRGILLVLFSCIISSFALPAGKRDFISHDYSFTRRLDA